MYVLVMSHPEMPIPSPEVPELPPLPQQVETPVAHEAIPSEAFDTIHRLPRRSLEGIAQSGLSLEEGGVLAAVRAAAQAELDFRNNKSISGGNFQHGLLKGKDVPVRKIIKDNVFNMSGNLHAHTNKEVPPEVPHDFVPKEKSAPTEKITPSEAEEPKAAPVGPVYYRPKAPDMAGQLYSDVPSKNPYALRGKAVEKGKGDFLSGVDYLSTEEIQDMVNYATGPDRAAAHAKARDAAYVDSKKYAGMHIRRRKHAADALSEEYAGKARQFDAITDGHHRTVGDIFNAQDRNLLTSRDLKWLQQELRDREAADTYIQKQFDTLGKVQDGAVDPQLQKLQFLGLEKSPNKWLDWNLGSIKVGPMAAGLAYDRRALQMVRDPAVIKYIFDHSAFHNVYDRLSTKAGKEQFWDFYQPVQRVLIEQMMNRLETEDQRNQKAA